MAHWDVTAELRGEHGRWSRSGVLKRLAEEASQARTARTYNHEEVKQVIGTLSPGKGKKVNGVHLGVHDKYGIYVAFPKAGGGRDSKYYKSPDHAARAVIEGHHHDERDPAEGPLPGHGGGFKEKLPEPGLPRPAAPQPSGRDELDLFENPRQKGQFLVLRGPGKEAIGTVQEWNGQYEAWHGGEYHGAYPTKERAARVVLALHKEGGKPEPKPAVEKPKLPETLPRLSDDEIFRRNIPQRSGPFEGKPPVISVRGQAVTQAQLKNARVDVMSAKSMTSKYNGQLDAPVVITKAPHGHRASPGKGTTFGAYGASKTSGYRTALELHSGMWTRSDADAVFMHEKNSGWWVPTDGDITMGQGVASHEYGHGVHDELVRAGVMSQPRSNNMADATKLATDPREKQFWTEFSAALGLPPPKETLAYTSGGQPGLNVGTWFRDNQPQIKKAVSTYGGKTVTEMFAELWCEYCNNSSARPPAVVYGNYVRATIGDINRKGQAAALC